MGRRGETDIPTTIVCGRLYIQIKKKSRNKCLQMTITFLELNNQFENTRSADLYIVYNIFTELSKMWFKITAFEKICLQNASMDGRSENNRTSPPPHTHTHFVYRGITIVYESTCPKIQKKFHILKFKKKLEF